MFNPEARADRKHRDREQRRAAANRRIGHDLAYWYEFSDKAPYIVAPIIITAGAAWAWHTLDHTDIARYLLIAGVALIVGWAARNLLSASPSARIADRADGVTRNGWHPVGIAGLMLVAAAYFVWRSL
jgi:hypothetical protein